MDVLLTAQLKTEANSNTMVFVFWGNNQTLDGQVDLNKTFVDQPLIMDFNGDMIPDIFGVIAGVSADSSTEVCYLTGRNTVWQPALSSPVKMRIPHSNAFIDLNKDFTAGE
ncbi:T-cell immunomodulatory protein-like [Coregonus clupeaformis]|uniref:T-cell immunomodulatory protein-like n=1 Tax=Coregonus clupeaformis TaxID=59861 RepID=UPI001E1C37B7|nr:T-cell immunomodulatory protein-like [Coregonus clupeaformis]